MNPCNGPSYPIIPPIRKTKPMVQGPAAGRQEHCCDYFPPAKFTALYEREEKHFVYLQCNWDVSQKWSLLPLGEMHSELLFSQYRMFSLISVRCPALALPSSVPRRVLCASPTQAQADLARRPTIYLI